MVQKNEDFSQSRIQELLQRPEAAQLLSLLKQIDPAALQQAVRLAFQGQTDRARDVLSPMLQDDKVQELTRKMRDGNGGI